jgi:hypothetical protein
MAEASACLQMGRCRFSSWREGIYPLGAYCRHGSRQLSRREDCSVVKRRDRCDAIWLTAIHFHSHAQRATTTFCHGNSTAPLQSHFAQVTTTQPTTSLFDQRLYTTPSISITPHQLALPPCLKRSSSALYPDLTEPIDERRLIARAGVNSPIYYLLWLINAKSA